MADRSDDRVFGGPRKHYRRTWSIDEVRAGAVVLLGLCAVAAWIAWRGRHPDPELTLAAPGLRDRSPQKVDRGPIPEGVAPAGWREGRLSTYDASNVYEKIDGREGYYKSFGFVRLHCLTLTAGEQTIDIELYDLGKSVNALGAAAGELPHGAAPQVRDGALSLIDKNALFLARGRFYLRALGSSAGEPVQAALRAVRDRFLAELPAESLPWSHALFAGVGVPPARVSYRPENAFSFDFAREVHVGLMADGDTELFASAQADPARARETAGRYAAGFSEYGESAGEAGGVRWIKDRYLSRFSAAGASGRFVIGVRGAADAKAGAALYQKLEEAVKSMPAPAVEGPAPSAGREEH